MSARQMELKRVSLPRSPLGRGQAFLVGALMLFSGVVGLAQSARSLIERSEEATTARGVMLSAYLAPWRGDVWQRVAISSAAGEAEKLQAMKARLMLSPVAGEDWLLLSRLAFKRGDLEAGKAALQTAFDIAPRSPSIERAELGLATVLESDVILDVALRRDLRWALLEAPNREARLSDLGALATPHGQAILMDVARTLPDPR